MFAVQRLMRIYPAFWASVVLVLMFNTFAAEPRFAMPVVLANLTLFPNFFSMPWMSGVYWTLSIEMIFYVICIWGGVIKFLAKYSVIFAVMVIFILLTVVPILLVPVFGKKILPIQFTSYYVSFLLSGMLLRICTRQNTKTWLPFAGASLPFLFVPVVAGQFFPVAGTFVMFKPHTSVLAHTAALGVFLYFVVFAQRTLAGWWLQLGESSYSLYLFHWPLCAMVIYYIGFATPAAAVTTMLVSVTLSVMVARLAFHWVERPSIQLGKKLSASLG